MVEARLFFLRPSSSPFFLAMPPDTTADSHATSQKVRYHTSAFPIVSAPISSGASQIESGTQGGGRDFLNIYTVDSDTCTDKIHGVNYRVIIRSLD